MLILQFWHKQNVSNSRYYKNIIIPFNCVVKLKGSSVESYEEPSSCMKGYIGLKWGCFNNNSGTLEKSIKLGIIWAFRGWTDRAVLRQLNYREMLVSVSNLNNICTMVTCALREKGM